MPLADRLKAETRCILDWLNGAPNDPPLLKAGLGHLWVITLHPFDDGNGRFAWAIGDLLLVRAVNQAQRTLDAVLTKVRFWQRWATMPLNERQVKLLNNLIDGFEGKLTSSK